MSRRRLLVYLGIVVTGALSLLGVGVFVIGVLVEFFNNRGQGVLPALSPMVQLALAGLCLAALMLTLWFVLVGLLLARQTRRSGSGYGDAYRLMESFRFLDAIPLLERSIREGKESSEVLMLLTSAYAYTGQLAKAQATADRAVQLYPEDPGAYVTLANGYRLQAAYDEAAAALRRALDHDPDQPVIWAELGFVQLLAGQTQAAQESFEHAARYPMPSMYTLRVQYHLMLARRADGNAQAAKHAQARMLAARDGLDVWKSGLGALRGTAYGTALHYEIAAIEQALVAVQAKGGI